MNPYITGTMIKRLREDKGLTQMQLADKLCVSDKAISKWETGRGYPDISLVESLASELGISVIELFAGNHITNRNRGSNMLHAPFYVCPICGNVIQSIGEVVVSCCGVVLPKLEEEAKDGKHLIRVEHIEDELYVTVEHEMTKTHYISFIAARQDNGWMLQKMYPEGNAEARFPINRVRALYAYCNHHGLWKADRSDWL